MLATVPRRIVKHIEAGLRRFIASRIGNRGREAWHGGDPSRAVALFEKAIRVNRRDARAMGDLAALRLGCGRHDEALHLLLTAVRIDPTIAGLHVNLGNLRLMLGDFPAAITSYHDALALDRSNCSAYANCFRAYMEICDWSGFEQHFQGLLDLRDAGDPTWLNRISAYMSLLVPLGRADQLRIAQSAARGYASMADLESRGDTARSGGRLNIAYLSGDFYDHATLHLAGGLFENHDRSRFRVLAYSTGPAVSDSFVDRVRMGCDEFKNISDLSAADAAKLIRQDGISILVDMKGYTGNSRPEILARRPAPIQVSFLGYPGTMGAEFIDYLIADRTVVPEAHFDDYSEKIVWMPHSYQVTDNRQAIAAAAPARGDYGLPENAFIFCSFNQSYKIDQRAFHCWMRILARVPNSVLWLMVNNPIALAQLSAAATATGISPTRLIFARPEQKARHLARLTLAHLMLDTFVVNAHTTTTDALWAGLPVLTLQGETFASRVASSVNLACGLETMICRTESEYEDKAVALATDSRLLARVREGLKDRAMSALFDTGGYVRNLETAYRMMWELREAGRRPAHLKVALT